MGRAPEYLGHGAFLDHPAGVHHHHPLGHLGHDAQVVGNHEDGHAELGLQLADEFQNLRLYGDVQGRGGFVRDQQLGTAREGHGDHHPLAHAPRQLVRVFVNSALRVGNLDLAQQVDGFGQGTGARQAPMEP